MELDQDVIIIGGGIAGLTAAQFSARENLKTLVIEELAAGGQALLVNDLENFPGFPSPVSGIDFSMRMEKQARAFGANFETSSVSKLEKEGEVFAVTTSKSVYHCRGVILATGSKHKKLGVPGEADYNGRGVSYCGTCDGPFFKNRKILVVGGGDTACEEAQYLSKLTDKLLFIHRGERFRAQRALSQRVLTNERISIEFSTECREIRGTDRVRSVILENTRSGKTSEHQIDGVFIFIGSTPNTSLVPELPKDPKGYVIGDDSLGTSIPGLYVAGDIRSMQFRPLVSSAADGALAAHNLAHYIFEQDGIL